MLLVITYIHYMYLHPVIQWFHLQVKGKALLMEDWVNPQLVQLHLKPQLTHIVGLSFLLEI